jgi:energy-coupling factor transporter ATP-binding protein EcfA2
VLLPGARPGGRSHAPLGVALQSPEDQLVCPLALDDIALGPRRLGLDDAAAAARARAAAAEAGLDPARLAETPPSQLSHGQRRRLAWAGVWALGAGIWLLDEPTAGLDGEGVAVLERALARHLAAGGAALVVHQDPRIDAWPARHLRLGEGMLLGDGAARAR